MKKRIAALLVLCFFLTGCQAKHTEEKAAPIEGATEIKLSDEQITVDGTEASEASSDAVYIAHDIVYYPTGTDFTFGEGEDADKHDAAEADAHTVVHITKAGKYVLSGKLSAGQIAVDLGENAEEDPNAVVTLFLNGVDITCTVAPAVIFYHVYECETAEKHTQTVDTTSAGANVFIMDDTENNVTGSYVARIYKPETVELSEDGTEVENAKKLHKYDGAFYSRMSMNIDGDNGILNIFAENEGLDTEMHLTVNGGDIRIESGDDGINTNEDEVSVTTVNGGKLTINVLGTMGEGDGIDSNGWIVINGGTIISASCARSGDSGIDSDMGISINGGTVIASGNMYDRITGGTQNYAVMSFAETQQGGETYTLKNEKGETVLTQTIPNAFSYLILSDAALTEGNYTLWCGETQLKGALSERMDEMGGGMPNMELPDGMELPEDMENMTLPEKPDGEQTTGEAPEKPDGEQPTGEVPEKPSGEQTMGEAPEKPSGEQTMGDAPEKPSGEQTMGEAPEKPDGEQPTGEVPEKPNGGKRNESTETAELSEIFVISAGANYFVSVTKV